jgi:hypothetical protein
MIKNYSQLTNESKGYEESIGMLGAVRVMVSWSSAKVRMGGFIMVVTSYETHK